MWGTQQHHQANIHFIGIPKGEGREKGVENLFKEINLFKEKS